MEDMQKVYQQHAQTVYKFLLAQCRDPGLAEELTQETFYRAVKQIKTFKGDSSVSTWLCGIARNVWLEYVKGQKKRQDMDSLAGITDGDGRFGAKGSCGSAEEAHMAEWENMQILKALHRLKEPVRETLYLRLIGNLTFKQIGEIMGRSENWARVTFYRGKEIIMKEVKRDEP